MDDNELTQLANRIGHSTDRIVGTANRLIDAIEKSSVSQDKHQRAIVALTIIIAISTVVYTCLTIWSAFLQNEEFRWNQTKNSQIELKK